MKNTRIESVKAMQTFSDNGTPAIQVTVTTEGGKRGVGAFMPGFRNAPRDIKILYDGQAAFHGLGMLRAVKIINTIIATKICGMDVDNQSAVDAAIMSSLAEQEIEPCCNITSPVSSAVLKAAAAQLGVPLYHHVGGASAFTIPVPGFLNASGSNRYATVNSAKGAPFYAFVAYDFATHDEADYAIWEVEDDWENTLAKEYGVRPHRGFSMAIPAGKIQNDAQMWDLMNRCIERHGYKGKMGLHANVSAGAFYDATTGLYTGLYDSQPKNREEMIAFTKKMATDYGFVVIQDPLEENDLESYSQITAETNIQIVGGDIFGGDVQQLLHCAQKKCFNTALLRVYRFQTISDCIHAVSVASSYGIGLMACDSAGEDEDIVDFAVGFHCGSIYMSGPASHGNRMPLVESEIGPMARFMGRSGLRGSRFELKHQKGD